MDTTQTYVTPLEQKMCDSGISSLTLQEKNDLIKIIADRQGVGYSVITDDYLLQHHKDLKIQELGQNCDDVISSGFTATNGNTYRCLDSDQINMIGQMVALINDTTITTVKWKTTNAGYVDHTRADWISNVYVQGLGFKQSTIFKLDNLVSTVTAATTDDAVTAVKFS